MNKMLKQVYQHTLTFLMLGIVGQMRNLKALDDAN